MNRRSFVNALAGGAGIALTGLMESFSVKNQGARGDAQADDTQAIQEAVNRGEGLVFFPKGSYRLTRSVRIELAQTGNTALMSDGSARILMEGPGPAFEFIGTHGGSAGPDTISEQVWNRERMPLVSGFEIRGGHPEAVGLSFVKTMEATISRMQIRRCRTGILFRERNRNPIISDCHIYHNLEYGILFHEVNLHQAIIANSHISYNSIAGICLQGGEMRNFQIVGNDIEYNYDDHREGCADVLIDMRGNGSTFREGTIVGNTIQARPSPGGANVRVLGAEELRSGGLLTLTGNLLGSQTDNIHLSYCRGVVISGNSLYSAAGRTLFAERCANLVFCGNPIDWNPDHQGKVLSDGIVLRDCEGVSLGAIILENCFQGSPEAGGAIEIENSRDVSITHCQILDPRHRGIVLTDAVRCRVDGCTILDRREESRLAASIQIRGASRDNVITNNLVPAGSLHIPEGTAWLAGNQELGKDRR